MSTHMQPPLARAMVLAAGRGERMRPLTDTCPKPLLRVRGMPLIGWHAQALAQGGFAKLVVNTDWLGSQITDYLSIFRTSHMDSLLSISYSDEGRDFGGALETAGGIARALPLLGDTFWVLAADVYMPGFAFAQTAFDSFVASGHLAHLWLVPNPPHHPHGDFGLDANGLATSPAAASPEPRYTYSTVGLYRRAFFDALPAGNPQGTKAALAPLLRAAMARGQISAELYLGPWTDVGTPARLAELNQTAPELNTLLSAK